MWFSKQHYAFELSKLGNEVYFINPTSKWRLRSLFSFNVHIKQESKNLYILSYKNNFPQYLFTKFFTFLNDTLNFRKIYKSINTTNKNIIWWKFEPYRFIKTKINKHQKTIYHLVDPYNFLWQDKYQVKNADLIVCTNPKYSELYIKKYPQSNLIDIPHGISDDEFTCDLAKVESIKKLFGNFLILIGSISKDLNIDLLEFLAENNIKLVILGTETHNHEKWLKTTNHKNIEYLGQVHAKEIKNYIAASCAGLIAYNFKNYVDENSRTPLKIINYLAQKKPIITSLKTTLHLLENNCIYNAFSKDKYLDLSSQALNNKLDVNNQLVEDFLNEHKYPKLINKIFNHLA